LQLSAPHVGHRFTFEQLPDAIRLFQTGKTVGKVVVEVP
jgi:alcohol dehydrogenase